MQGSKGVLDANFAGRSRPYSAGMRLIHFHWTNEGQLIWRLFVLRRTLTLPPCFSEMFPVEAVHSLLFTFRINSRTCKAELFSRS